MQPSKTPAELSADTPVWNPDTIHIGLYSLSKLKEHSSAYPPANGARIIGIKAVLGSAPGKKTIHLPLIRDIHRL
jgi:hypothetical protein